ncbi:hypothetical protein [Mycolicibacterium litorale]|uniref:Serine/threonine protein kinase n=1 Tax=Mycolicibacterium litorale TaxID=758802 RepID=A0AAD1INX9_9MYCO|nr:hypothetical protein [Mycolicibacterium litorale]MCV7417321.1 hypothetical protein [Mycolicibacterium litorale]TDY05111.1 hypothetical protein BCL50_3894 [Mycolicibacterium litorale]BBY18544.1 hypothetical protein MLIT_41360 [Mycolicibacterium litorale]
MTWPPPPPSSDPWATGPAPDADDRDGAASATEPAPAQAPEPLWEPLADPVADNPEPLAEPIDQPIEQPIDQPVVDHHEPAPVAGHAAEPEYAPTPAPEPDGWSPAYTAPPPVVPRPQMAPPPEKKPVWLIAAAVAAVVVVGVVAWLLIPSGDDGDTATGPTTPTPTRTADPRAEAELRTLLPRGYAADACEMQTPPAGALAMASCGPNSDPGGPPSATYTITADDTALDTAFNDVVEASAIVTCPGNIQSPGPWRRNATPQKVSGVLFCGLQADRPVVAWTNTDAALVAVVESGPQGPGLDQLYTWWTQHS